MGNFSKLLPNDSIPKWQIALMISVPVAFGLGYLYYKLNVGCKQIVISNNVLKDNDINEAKFNHGTETNINKIEISPKNQTENLKIEGNEFFKSGDYDEAVRCYSEAIQICPEGELLLKSLIYQNKAATYERLNNYEKVLEDCTAALNLNNRYVKAMLRRAKAAEKVKNLDLALEDLATACTLESFQNTEIIQELDRIAKATANRDVEHYISNHEPKLPSKFFIKTFISTYQHGSARDKINAEDEISVSLFNTLKLIEISLLNSENIEEKCSDLIQKCEETGQELIKIETLLLRATYFLLSKQNDKAFSDLDYLINKKDIDERVLVNALIKRGTLYQHQGETHKREADFNKAIEVDENNPDIYHHLGQIHLILDNISESVNNFRKAVALDSEFPVTVIQHCFAEYKYAASIQDTDTMMHYLKEFQNILKKFPDNIECITLFAQVLTERQEYSEAEKLFNEAIQREPKHAALLIHKALLILQWKADIEAAKELIYSALKLDNDCEFAYETIATIEMQIGNLNKAIEYFNEAIKRFSSVEELFHLFCVRNTSVAQVKAEERVGRFSGSMSFPYSS